MNESLSGILLQTARLRIETLRAELFPDYCAIVCNSDTGLYDEEFPKSLEDAYSAFLESIERDPFSSDGWNEYGVFRDSGELVGLLSHCEFGNEFEVTHMRMGYHFNPDFRGQGYATEAVAALIDALFEQGSPRIECIVHPDNRPSLALLERLNFRCTTFNADCNELLYVAERPSSF